MVKGEWCGKLNASAELPKEKRRHVNECMDMQHHTTHHRLPTVWLSCDKHNNLWHAHMSGWLPRRSDSRWVNLQCPFIASQHLSHAACASDPQLAGTCRHSQASTSATLGLVSMHRIPWVKAYESWYVLLMKNVDRRYVKKPYLCPCKSSQWRA